MGSISIISINQALFHGWSSFSMDFLHRGAPSCPSLGLGLGLGLRLHSHLRLGFRGFDDRLGGTSAATAGAAVLRMDGWKSIVYTVWKRYIYIYVITFIFLQTIYIYICTMWITHVYMIGWLQYVTVCYSIYVVCIRGSGRKYTTEDPNIAKMVTRRPLRVVVMDSPFWVGIEMGKPWENVGYPLFTMGKYGKIMNI